METLKTFRKSVQDRDYSNAKTSLKASVTNIINRNIEEYKNSVRDRLGNQHGKDED